MTTADLVNRIVEKLGGNRVEFVRIGEQVEFRHASNFYRCRFEHITRSIQVGRLEDGYSYQVGCVDDYSTWVEGVLNGMTRDESGVLA